MVAIAEEPLVRGYDDGPDVPLDNMAKEREFRRGFLESARHIVRVWAHPPEPEKPGLGPVSVAELLANRRCNPDAEEEAAWKQRGRLRRRFAVYGRGDAGAKTYHLGFRPGHVLAAARLRGRHHAMVYVTELWRDLETADLDIYDPKLLCPWLRAVEHWASKPIRPGMATPPPPRVMEVAGPIEVPAEHDPAPETTTSSPPEKAPSTSPAASLTTSSPPPRIRLTRADQIETRPPLWLLRGILEKDTLALIFGDPGCGKSFLAIDWACRIATGTPWRGHGVNGGPVVYVAGEGRQGFGRRVQAWSQYHHVSLTGVPLYMSPPAAIPEPTDLMDLVAAIDMGVAAVGRPALIVIDTLARCFGGGDENSTQDMSKFVAACDLLRQRYDCTILIVHHAGHGDKSRARGAIALKAALDAEYRLENEGGMVLTATKMKDAEMPPPLAMRLVSVEIPGMHDDDGNVVTSVAIELLDAETSAIVAQAKSAMSGKWQKMGLQIARRLVGRSDDGQMTLEAWREACATAGMVRQNQHRVLQALVARGEIIVDGERLSLPDS